MVALVHSTFGFGRFAGGVLMIECSDVLMVIGLLLLAGSAEWLAAKKGWKKFF